MDEATLREKLLDEPGTGCPNCLAQKLNQSGLQLVFAICCGLCLCVNCKDKFFADHSHNRKVRSGIKASAQQLGFTQCQRCNQWIRPEDFSSATRETQLARKEKKIRAEIAQHINLSLDDFNGDRSQYNEYLEAITDIVFDKVEGTLDQQSEADVRLRELCRKHQGRIDASLGRVINGRTPILSLAVASQTYVPWCLIYDLIVFT